MRIPRIVIAAPNSSSGKTTIAIGLMAALTAQGQRVAPFKIGPDYIDPGYHALATGHPGRNLDAWLCGTDQLPGLLAHGSLLPDSEQGPADISVIEGVMGFYDGRLGDTDGVRGFGSSAHVATLTDSPVILVADATGVSRTLAATISGLANARGMLGEGQPDPRVVGVIINKCGSARAVTELRDGFAAVGLPVLGAVPRSKDLVVPSRHLGLVPAAERDQAQAAVDAAAELVAAHVDLAAVLELASQAPDLAVTPWQPGDYLQALPGIGQTAQDSGSKTDSVSDGGGVSEQPTGKFGNVAGGTSALASENWEALSSPLAGATGPNSQQTETQNHELTPVAAQPTPRIAIAAGRAFTFRYAETAEMIRAAGIEVVEFDPMTDEHLPEGTHGLYLGGGFPEVYAEELAANRPLIQEIRAAVKDGLPTWAECAGMLYLCRRLDGADMAGALPMDAAMTPRLSLGYRTLTALTDSLLTRAGEQLNSHEFHRTATTILDDSWAEAWQVESSGNQPKTEGLAGENVLACYQHIHPVGAPQLMARFVAATRARAASGATVQLTEPVEARVPDPDLRHHGDNDLAPGLVDLAVNVHPATAWFIDEIKAASDDWGAYPDARPARRALGEHHGINADQILVTAGGADAFTLLMRSFPGAKTCIVHPQFTEPEQAARVAGHTVSRVLLRPDEGFRIDPSRIPNNADLVIIGNPTNPTGVLYSADELRALVKPGRTLVIDEAFMDFVLDTESLIAKDMTGIVVVRSATKLWGIPGLRAGYLVASPEVITRMEKLQEPWAVSAPALKAMELINDPRAAEHAVAVGEITAARRAVLVAELAAAGFPVAGDSESPFVLVDASRLKDPVSRLAEQGFAVRRGDTFPGLGPGWIRLAVRDEDTSRQLAVVLKNLSK